MPSADGKYHGSFAADGTPVLATGADAVAAAQDIANHQWTPPANQQSDAYDPNNDLASSINKHIQAGDILAVYGNMIVYGRPADQRAGPSDTNEQEQKWAVDLINTLATTPDGQKLLASAGSNSTLPMEIQFSNDVTHDSVISAEAAYSFNPPSNQLPVLYDTNRDVMLFDPTGFLYNRDNLSNPEYPVIALAHELTHKWQYDDIRQSEKPYLDATQDPYGSANYKYFTTASVPGKYLDAEEGATKVEDQVADVLQDLLGLNGHFRDQYVGNFFAVKGTDPFIPPGYA